jgi:hypothetical protein
VYKVAEIRQKYEQHIRLATKIFEDKNFLAIPKTKRMTALGVLLVLLKYVNAKTGKCYPRIQTICDHLGCGRNVVSNALKYLAKYSIIKKTKLSSTNLYEKNPYYIVGFKSADYIQTTAAYNLNNCRLESKDINKTNSIKPSYITTKVDEIIKKGLQKDKLIDELATIPLQDLENDKNNVYYCKLAIVRKKELERQKNIVPTEKILNALKNIGGKKSNAFYKAKVEYNKRNNLDWKGNPKK